MYPELRLTNISDLELLEELCSTQDDEQLYTEFVNRYIDNVTANCLNTCKKRNIDSHIGRQIAHDTFERVRKYKSFKIDKITISNSRLAVIVYLNRISLSLFNNFHKENSKEDIVHRTYFDDLAESDGGMPNGQDLKSKKDLALIIFKKLNDKEREVILADLEYKKFHKYLPDDVTDQLAIKLGITKASIRKIRERAKAKIDKAITEFNGN